MGSADLRVGCRAGLLARAGTLAARTSPVQPLRRAALHKCAIYGQVLHEGWSLALAHRRGSGQCAKRRAATRRLRTVPRPGVLRKGAAYSFAGRGISVVCLATYKAKEFGAYLRQKSAGGKIYGITGLLSSCWGERLDCRIKWDAAVGPRFGPAHARHRLQPDSATLACFPTGDLRIGDDPPEKRTAFKLSGRIDCVQQLSHAQLPT